MNRDIDCYGETDRFAVSWAETSRHSGRGRRCPWQVGLILALGVSVGVCDRTLAQIVPDATLGAEQSVVTPTDRIEGGALRGANLFHSFQEFNVGEGQRVYFANPEGIENILSRITGGNISNILGTLGVEGTANLFLLNPNGIVFGENARLDIDGSFVASTADSFVFGNGSNFSATNPEAPPLLTLNITPGLQYGSNRAGTIANRGNLAVGEDFTLSASNLNLQGQLQAGGDLTLQGQDTVRVRDSVTHPFVAAAGNRLLVQGNEAIDIFALNHPNSGLLAGGDMVLRSGSTVGGDAHYTAGGSFRIEQMDGTPGDLFSPEDPIILTNGDVVLNNYQGASLHILAGGSVTMGNVIITGPDTAANAIGPNHPDPFLASLATVSLSDGTPLAPLDGSARPTLDVRAGIDWTALGGFGGLTLIGNVPPLLLAPNATGADIAIGSITNAGGQVFLTNQYANAPSLRGDITTGFIRTSVDTGNAGDIVVNASGNIASGGVESFVGVGGIGDGGNITFISEAGAINTRFGSVNSSTGLGSSGNINFTAFGDIATGEVGSYIGDGGIGLAGDIILTSEAGAIDTRAGTLISSTDSGFSGDIVLTAAGNIFTGNIESFSNGIGDAGSIRLTSDASVFIENSSVQSQTFGEGRGGDIDIRANAILLSNLAFLKADTEGLGESGNINLTTQFLSVTDGSEVLARTFAAGKAGDITVAPLDPTNPSLVFLSGVAPAPFLADGVTPGGFSSGLFATTENDAIGDGGTIRITADTLRLENGAVLSARTRSVADGGDIVVNVNTLDMVSGGQMITAAYDRGAAGRIEVNATGTIRISGIDPTYTTRFIQLRDSLNERFLAAGQTPEEAFQNAIEETQAVIDPIGFFSSLQASELSGLGKAGNISVTASAIELSDIGALETSTNGASDGGNVTIRTQSLALTGGAEVRAQTFGAGRAGDIMVEPLDRNAPSFVLLSGVAPFTRINELGVPDGGFSSGFFATTETPEGGAVATGNGGTILVTTDSLRIEDGAALSARTRSAGDGGDVVVNVNTLDITGGGQILTTAFRSGRAGGITVNATGDIAISGLDPSYFDRFNQVRDGFIDLGLTPEEARSLAEFTIDPVDPTSSLQAQAIGSDSNGSGNIIVRSTNGSLSLRDGAQLSANTFGLGRAGDIEVDVRGSITLSGLTNLAIDGTNFGYSSAILSQVGQGAVADGGNIRLQGESLAMTELATIAAGTFGQGDAGDVSVRVEDTVAIASSGSIRTLVETGGVGDGGDIDIQGRSLTLTEGGQIGAGVFRGENNLPGGRGRGGSIRINATDFVDFSGVSTVQLPIADPFDPSRLLPTQGFSSGLLVSTEEGAVGPAGNIAVFTNNMRLANGAIVVAETGNASNAGNITLVIGNALTIEDEGLISVSGIGTGNPGNLDIDAGSLFLNRQGRIRAETASGENANINLRVGDSIRMRFNSEISTEAGGTGNGGNMTIEAGKFILAVLSEDSDIVANAFEGRGGNISARAQLVRGFRQFENARTPESDFIASSELGIDGTVDIDTEEQLEQSLPQVPVDPTRMIDRTCQAVRDDKLSRFIITGRGGFPASPTESLSGDAIVSEWVTLDAEEETQEESEHNSTQTTNSEGLTSGEIIEAQGWLVDEQGRVVLTATAPTVTPYQGQQILTECSAALNEE